MSRKFLALRWVSPGFLLWNTVQELRNLSWSKSHQHQYVLPKIFFVELTFCSVDVLLADSQPPLSNILSGVQQKFKATSDEWCPNNDSNTVLQALMVFLWYPAKQNSRLLLCCLSFPPPTITDCSASRFVANWEVCQDRNLTAPIPSFRSASCACARHGVCNEFIQPDSSSKSSPIDKIHKETLVALSEMYGCSYSAAEPFHIRLK